MCKAPGNTSSSAAASRIWVIPIQEKAIILTLAGLAVLVVGGVIVGMTESVSRIAISDLGGIHCGL